MQFYFLCDFCYDPGLQLPQAQDRMWILGTHRKKPTLKHLKFPKSVSEAASGPPVGQMGIWISKKNPSHGRGVWPSEKNPPPFHFNIRTWEEKSSHFRISLLKWNAGGALSSVSTTFFHIIIVLGTFSRSFYSVLSKEYLLLLRLYHVMLPSSSEAVSFDGLAIYFRNFMFPGKYAIPFYTF